MYPNVDTEGSLLPATGRIKADYFVKMSPFVFQRWNNMESFWTWKSQTFKVVRLKGNSELFLYRTVPSSDSSHYTGNVTEKSPVPTSPQLTLPEQI